ncbi:hypothetical protein, partial [Escherichia coli]
MQTLSAAMANVTQISN